MLLDLCEDSFQVLIHFQSSVFCVSCYSCLWFFKFWEIFENYRSAAQTTEFLEMTIHSKNDWMKVFFSSSSFDRLEITFWLSSLFIAPTRSINFRSISWKVILEAVFRLVSSRLSVFHLHYPSSLSTLPYVCICRLNEGLGSVKQHCWLVSLIVPHNAPSSLNPETNEVIVFFNMIFLLVWWLWDVEF